MNRSILGGRLQVSQAVLLLSVLLLATSWHASAQNANAGEIRGTVTSADGAVIVNAVIKIKNVDTGVVTTVSTNAAGLYDVPSLIPGNYEATITSPTFRTFVLSGIVLRDAPISVNAVLQIGAVSEVVTVQDTSNELQTENATQSLTLEPEAVEAIPNVGNDVYNLFALVPGVNGGGTQATNGKDAVGINGIQSNQQSILLNGGTVLLIGSQNLDGAIGPDDFIAATQFSTSNVTAEAGNGTSVLNIITKSGTNRFHGSVYDYNQSSTLAARNYFGAGVPSAHSNQVGATLGGPIKRDKLFFFGGFQYLKSTTGSDSEALVPTAAEKAGDFSALGVNIYDPATTVQSGTSYSRTQFSYNGKANVINPSRFSPQAAKIQSYLPAPNYTSPNPNDQNNYLYSGLSTSVDYFYNARIDYNITPSNHLNASSMEGVSIYSYPKAFTSPIGDFALHGDDFTNQVSDTWTISPKMVNEARVAMVRALFKWISGDINKNYPTAIGIPNPGSNVFPDISISGALGLGFGHQLDANIGETTVVPSDVFTLIHGRHVVKVGGEYDNHEININFGGYSDGNFGFSGIATRNPALGSTSPGLGYADFLLGDVASYSIAITPETGNRLKAAQFFIEDDYSPRPNLIFNIGLRYQIQGGWKEAFDRVGDFDPTLTNPATSAPGAVWFAANSNSRKSLQASQYNLVQPRFGVAWTPLPRYSVRAGFGLYTEMFGYNTYDGGSGLGYIAQNSVSSTDSITPAFTLAQGPPSPIVAGSSTLNAASLNGQSVPYSPYHLQSPEAEEWNLDLQHEFSNAWLVDLAYIGSRAIHQALAGDFNQVPASLIYHAASGANMQQYRPFPTFQSLPYTFAGGFSHYNSLQARLQRRYSHGFQFLANFTYAKTQDNGTGSGYGGPGAKGSVWQNTYDTRSIYGNSQLDMPLVLNGDLVYDVPVGKGKRFLNQGGPLEYILGGWQASTLFQIHSGIPFTPTMSNNLDGSLAGTWFPNRIGSGTVSNPNINRWFNPAAFVSPAVGTYGNSSRDILFGPAWRTFDLSLGKHFPTRILGEASNFGLRIDASDVFNHPNFGNPNAVIGSASAGVITSANTSRAIQLSGKLTF